MSTQDTKTQKQLEREVIAAFKPLKGAKYIGVRGYENRYGEVSNYTVNVNIKNKTVKMNDLTALESLTPQDLKGLSLTTKIAESVMETALTDLIVRGKKNLSDNIEEHTNQSKGQIDAYFYPIAGNTAVRVHRETLDVEIIGLQRSKKVLIEGNYPIVNHRVLTKAKNSIKKHLELRGDKYRTFKVGNFSSLKISGAEIEGEYQGILNLQ